MKQHSTAQQTDRQTDACPLCLHHHYTGHLCVMNRMANKLHDKHTHSSSWSWIEQSIIFYWAISPTDRNIEKTGINPRRNLWLSVNWLLDDLTSQCSSKSSSTATTTPTSGITWQVSGAKRTGRIKNGQLKQQQHEHRSCGTHCHLHQHKRFVLLFMVFYTDACVFLPILSEEGSPSYKSNCSCKFINENK